MNVINEVTSWLSPQNVGTNYGGLKTTTAPKAPENSSPDSFFSILKLLDVNADNKTDTQELKFGAGFFINSFILSHDQNSDEALDAQEAGVAPAVVSSLDTDSDGTVSAKELITPADKIIDGLMPILDANGNGALDRGELAIFEMLFGGLSTSAAASQSEPNGVFTSDSSDGSNLKMDMNALPDALRQAGFQGSDNQLYYALGSTYANWPWQPDPNDPVSVNLSDRRDEMYSWFDNNVMDLASKMEADPALTATVITNDGPDKLGGRLGPAIMEKLQKFGDRVQLGTVYS